MGNKIREVINRRYYYPIERAPLLNSPSDAKIPTILKFTEKFLNYTTKNLIDFKNL